MMRCSLLWSAGNKLAGKSLMIVALVWTAGAESPVNAQARRGAAPPAAAPAAATPAATAASKATYASVYNGWKWWHVYCYRCHGVNATNATLAPNLLDENRHMAKPVFLRTVRTGREPKGMPEWGKLLNAKQMNDLYVYVRARADKVLPAGRPDEVGPPRGKPWNPPAGWTPK